MNYHNLRLKDIFGWRRNPKGEVGIEVEVEGGPWPDLTANPIPNWEYHEDHSLRNGGAEYVIRQPIGRDKVLGALETLEVGLRDARKVFSYRTSVHVHINVQQLTIAQWVAFIAAFTVLEEALVDVVGPKRAGNKFCLRIKDADEPLNALRKGIREGRLRDYIGGDLKYASMNITATQTHGTLEFRAMEGNLDPKRINDWVQVLGCIKDYACEKAESPMHIANQLSALGPLQWARMVLPEGNSITDQVLRRADLNDVMYEGIRLVQDLCYCSDWSKDPFREGAQVQYEAPQVVLDDPMQFDPFPGPDLNAVWQRMAERVADAPPRRVRAVPPPPMPRWRIDPENF